MSSSSEMNKYWIPHLDIHKKVITQELQYYLGPGATGEDGFLITTPGPCLTDEQIDDICVKSKEMWERQAAARAQTKPEKPLKRPLHQPVLISKAVSGDLSRKSRDDRWRNDTCRRHDERRRDWS
ncbi:hypothetical protein QBC33DRAFT_511781 [Phialemonium atrogriseum]|uniref:Uncharacterized protein n=1 Tax=Phialemonium atrogriseum TaxID=1093897 RepID=A0AAJ0FQ67_9PEZI|nr:uncharacterized protein QBC33DRAFT_511781 [Phialemonium atrogriseum]KAK1770983.1 hypothetical protein QBC33DRAFT_511781 [Phialemonium atrogriseum]